MDGNYKLIPKFLYEGPKITKILLKNKNWKIYTTRYNDLLKGIIKLRYCGFGARIDKLYQSKSSEGLESTLVSMLA